MCHAVGLLFLPKLDDAFGAAAQVDVIVELGGRVRVFQEFDEIRHAKGFPGFAVAQFFERVDDVAQFFGGDAVPNPCVAFAGNPFQLLAGAANGEHRQTVCGFGHQVQIAAESAVVFAISDGYDLALRNGNPPQFDSLIARTVGSQQMLTCAAPGYLVQHGTPQSPDDLAHHQCLHFLHGGRVSRWRFQQKGKETTFQGSGRFSADNGEALLELALSAFGIVQLPHYLVQTALDAGSLKSVLSDFQPKPVPVMAVYPSRKQLSPKVRALVDMMGEAWGKAV